MRKFLALAGLSLLLAALAMFVVITSRSLPPMVVTHFALDGTPNGFMSRDGYMTIMLLLVVPLPLLMAELPAWLARKGGLGLNIPNRSYWLMPERIEQTAAYLGLHSKVFSVLFSLFLTYLHTLIVTANTHVPVALPQAKVLVGLAVFLVMVAGWGYSLHAHFNRIEPPPVG